MKFSMTGQEKGGLSIQVTELLYFYKDNKMSEFHLLFLHKNNPENCLIIQLNIEDISLKFHYILSTSRYTKFILLILSTQMRQYRLKVPIICRFVKIQFS